MAYNKTFVKKIDLSTIMNIAGLSVDDDDSITISNDKIVINSNKTLTNGQRTAIKNFLEKKGFDEE